MKKALFYIGIALLLLLAGWWGYTRFIAPSPAPDSAEATPAPEETENVIWASGKLTPRQWAQLSAATGGRVTAIYVVEGDEVAVGAPLIAIEHDLAESQLQVAQATLAEAEAAEKQLLAGATAAQVAAARAEVSAAEAAVALAQAQLDQAKAAVAAAEAQVAIAQAQYTEIASHPTAMEKAVAQAEVDVAAAGVENAQAGYNIVRGDPHASALPQSLVLQQATASYNAARAAYDALAQGPTPQQLAVARSQIAAARVQVEIAQAQIPAAEAAVLAAQAQLARSQASLQGVLDGATAEEKAMVAARVRAAQAGATAADVQLAQTQVLAPFAGQVGLLAARLGEMATPGSVVAVLGDAHALVVETTDLRETDVARIQLGMAAEVSFDALPGRTFTGVIDSIAPMSTVEKGSTNYKVVIAVPDLDPALRWGMTAFVNITALK